MKAQRFSFMAGRVAVTCALAMALMMSATAHAALAGSAGTTHLAGKLKLTAGTEVGGVVLPRGEYQVEVRKAGEGATVEFARWNYNPYAQEGLPVWDLEVMATVPAQPHALNLDAAQTGLLFASAGKGKAVALRISGSNVEYGF